MVKYGLGKTSVLLLTLHCFCNLTFICSPASLSFTDSLEDHGWLVAEAKIHSSVYENFFNVIAHLSLKNFFFFRK